MLRARGRETQVRSRSGQQPIHLVLDDGVTLAGAGLQADPVYHVNVPASILDETKMLQSPRSFGDAFAAHAEQACDQILRHGQFLRGKSIHGPQEPATELLFN